ncbi:MAG: RNA helicase [Acidobacteria bacterium]|nr:MAG: RNA helicase [Acidobacteriota bacterium]
MFSQLGLSPTACASLARLGYETPTPIQTEAIPLALTGVDLLARAHTGTGKTAAFGLPMIDRLSRRGSGTGRRTPRGLVLVPTRELAVQVHQALSAYAASTSLRVAAVFGGVAMNGQVQALRRGADIVVATPGRLIDHLQRRTVELSAVDVLTLDEADRMLDMGFLPALRRVVAVLPRRRQTLLFSATMPEAVIRLSVEFTHDAVRVDVSAQQVVAATVTHHVHHVAVERKRDMLTHILTQHGVGQALVFCRTKRGANRVGEDLGRRGVRTDVIHGNKSQGARSRALDDFKAGRVRVLVATDIAARGLDIAHLPLVVNYDLPLVAEDYVHRVGRTGRAGQHGRAVSLVTASEAGLLRQIQQVVAAPLERVAAPIVNATEARRAIEGVPTRSHAAHASRSVRGTSHGNRDQQISAGRRRAGARRPVSAGRPSAA